MRSDSTSPTSGLKPVRDPSTPAGVDGAIRGAVVALGNFDGFHLGHQAVVARAIARAREEGRPALVATFDPHPVRLFNPDAPSFLLTSIEQRTRLFEAFGADGALALPFDRALAALSPEGFVTTWLRDWLGAAVVVTGADFCFGRGRAGDTEALRSIGARHGIAAEAVDVVRVEAGVVSSTRVRQRLAAGEVDAATRLLSRPHRIEGVVQPGIRQGRIVAQVALGDHLKPRPGTYAMHGHLPDGRTLTGTAHLTDDPASTLLELRSPDLAGNLHGQTIAVDLISFLGSETRLDPPSANHPALRSADRVSAL